MLACLVAFICAIFGSCCLTVFVNVFSSSIYCKLCADISNFSLVQSRTALRSFSSPEGDHLTLLNIYHASDELLETSKQGSSEEKAQKKLRKWCKQNFINSRSLKHARDIHRFGMVS